MIGCSCDPHSALPCPHWADSYGDAIARKSKAKAKKEKRAEKAKGLWGKRAKKKKSPSLSKLKKLLWEELRAVVYAMSEFCLTCGSSDSPVACHIVPSSEGAVTAFFLPNIYRGCNSCNKAEVSRRGQWVKRFEEVFGADYVNALYQMVKDEIEKPINERFQLKKWWVLEQTGRMRRLRGLTKIE